VQLWEDSHVIDAALRLEAAPGHTPGSSVLKLVSGSEQALFAGDLVHTPLQVAEADHNSCFCEDPAGARATRRSLFGWASDHAALVLPAHFSGHSALEVEHRGDGFAIRRWAGLDRL
jgi:glyoxylase-like metal-dependent hydrolase (beta-lactamase superfamily II)